MSAKKLPGDASTHRILLYARRFYPPRMVSNFRQRHCALRQLAMQGDRDRDAVRTLLKQKVDVNIAQGDGMTALHWAAHHNDVEMAKALLLAAGARAREKPSIADRKNFTPFALACTNINALYGRPRFSKPARARQKVIMACWTPLITRVVFREAPKR